MNKKLRKQLILLDFITLRIEENINASKIYLGIMEYNL